MRNRYIKLICILFVCLAAAVLVCGCENNAPDSSQTTTTAAAETEPPSSEITLIDNGKPLFRLIRPDDASDEEIDAAIKIREHLVGLCPGETFVFTDDFSRDGVYDDSTVEILVGRTGYPQTQEVLDSISYGDFGVVIVGNKVVVTSWQDTSMSLLAQRFCDLVTKSLSADKKTLTLKSEDCFTTTIVPTLSKIPVFGNIRPDRIVNCGDSAYQLFMSSTDTGTYTGITSELERSGFVSVSQRTVNNNLFSVYTGNDSAVTVYHTPSNKTTRVIVEPESNYFVSETSTGKAVTTPKLTMIGRKYADGNTYLGTEADSGLMCFLIRLSDGRFIVIDGGVSDGSWGSYSQALYACMLDQAVDKNNIVIAAWIFTHSHSDHIGGFCSFSAVYSKQVRLESIILNFPSEGDSNVSNDEKNAYSRFFGQVSNYYKGTPMYKAHTGHVYNIGDAVIEIFYTHEDYVTKTRTIASSKNWNNSSLIFSVDIAGERIMFLGDSQEDPNNLTAKIFGSYLKSDIVQVAHHGGIGGTNAIYAAIDPEIALFTTSDALVPVYLEKFTYNYYLINQLHVREYYNSATRITSWDLPYHATSSGFIK